jgi:hypothetical protein
MDREPPDRDDACGLPARRCDSELSGSSRLLPGDTHRGTSCQTTVRDES